MFRKTTCAAGALLLAAAATATGGMTPSPPAGPSEAAAAAAVPATPAPAALAAPSVEVVPYRMDASNQAGWWRPLEQWGDSAYVAYNAWGGPTAGGATDTHTVYIARRAPDGTWSRGCLPAADGACAVWPDDIGHRNPTIAIDGDGYIHAFVALHNDSWRYYRSDQPGDVTSMVDRSLDLPDQGGMFTYPVASRVPNGDVYLAVRAYPHGHLYRWDDATDRWSRVAVFASQGDYVVYPDDVVGDAAGNVHIAWEWAYGGAGALRHRGSYLRYSPAAGRFYDAAGSEVTVPATASGPVVYQPLEGEEEATDRDATHDPGVQSGKVAIDPATGLPSIAYRYRATPGGRFQVRLAQWTGSGWRRLTVYAGADDTTAAVDVSVYGGRTRVYYARRSTIGDLQAVAASRGPDGAWAETALAPGIPVERLSVIRRGATDLLYLAAPTTHQLHYGTLPW